MLHIANCVGAHFATTPLKTCTVCTVWHYLFTDLIRTVVYSPCICTCACSCMQGEETKFTDWQWKWFPATYWLEMKSAYVSCQVWYVSYHIKFSIIIEERELDFSEYFKDIEHINKLFNEPFKTKNHQKQR